MIWRDSNRSASAVRRSTSAVVTRSAPAASSVRQSFEQAHGQHQPVQLGQRLERAGDAHARFAATLGGRRARFTRPSAARATALRAGEQRAADGATQLVEAERLGEALGDTGALEFAQRLGGAVRGDDDDRLRVADRDAACAPARGPSSRAGRKSVMTRSLRRARSHCSASSAVRKVSIV